MRTIRFDHENLCPSIEGIRFNPSIIESNDGYLVGLRNNWKRSELYGCWLDKQFQPTGRWQHIPLPIGGIIHGNEDIRLYRIAEKLHCSFTRFTGRGTQVMHARLREDDLAVEQLCWPQMAGSMVREKNWVPFNHLGQMYFVYSISPHVIIHSPFVDDGIDPFVERIAETPFTGKWTGGMMRGGCPPVLHRGLYYHFFHGCWKNFDSGRRLYNCGLVCFEPKPPFRIVRYTPRPLDVASTHDTPKDVPVDCIFPGGAILVDGHWCISYGVHDKFCELRFYQESHIESLLQDC